MQPCGQEKNTGHRTHQKNLDNDDSSLRSALGLGVLGGAAVAALLRTQDLSEQAAGEEVETRIGLGNRHKVPSARGDGAGPVAYSLALLVVLASYAFTLPQATDIQPIDESAASIIRFETTYPDMIGITASTQEAPTDSPLVAQYLAGEPLQKAALVAGSGQVETLRVGGASVTARVQADGPAAVLFYTYDFPGWRVRMDGEPVAHRTEPPYGLIAVDVPAGEHTLHLRHGTTPARTAGTLISLASLALVLVMFWLDARQQRPEGPATKAPSHQGAS